MINPIKVGLSYLKAVIVYLDFQKNLYKKTHLFLTEEYIESRP